MFLDIIQAMKEIPDEVPQSEPTQSRVEQKNQEFKEFLIAKYGPGVVEFFVPFTEEQVAESDATNERYNAAVEADRARRAREFAGAERDRYLHNIIHYGRATRDDLDGYYPDPK